MTKYILINSAITSLNNVYMAYLIEVENCHFAKVIVVNEVCKLLQHESEWQSSMK